MYATIEADIENGFIHAVEASRLPPRAHVLITLLSAPVGSLGAKSTTGFVRTPHPTLKHSMELFGDLVNIDARLV